MKGIVAIVTGGVEVDSTVLMAILLSLALTLVDALVLIIFLSIVDPPRASTQQPGSTIDRSTFVPAPRVGFLERFGPQPSFVICLGVMFVLNMLRIDPAGAILAFIGWWTLALTLFRLTIRQTIKANIVLGLALWVTLVVFGALLGTP